MRRSIVLGLVLVLGAVSVGVAGFQAGGGQQERMVTIDKLRDNLFVMRGGGGNTAVFVQSNGVTVVDTKLPGWGQPLLEQIRKLTDRPVTTIINTHTHFDHVSGNVEFPESVVVVTHVNTARNMEQMRPVTGLQQGPQPNIFKENKGMGLPKRTFTDRLTLGSGSDQVDLYYFGRGHTDGDAWVVFPAARVMHAGDIFLGKAIPILDANNGGSGVALPDTLAKAASTVQNVDSIITGHSTVMTMADLREFAEFNRAFLMAVQAGLKNGRTVDQIAATWKNPARFTGYGDPQPARVRSNVQVIVDELR